MYLGQQEGLGGCSLIWHNPCNVYQNAKIGHYKCDKKLSIDCSPRHKDIYSFLYLFYISLGDKKFNMSPTLATFYKLFFRQYFTTENTNAIRTYQKIPLLWYKKATHKLLTKRTTSLGLPVR